LELIDEFFIEEFSSKEKKTTKINKNKNREKELLTEL
jgi:hypothetical protein